MVLEELKKQQEVKPILKTPITKPATGNLFKNIELASKITYTQFLTSQNTK